jgi:thiol-disulfide isomerase/thioredoxin
MNTTVILRSTAMMRYVKTTLAVAVLLGSAAIPVRAQTLGIGDLAPKLEVKSFVKGEPVSEFEPGKNYVVEFWATWCGPCKTSIPHLTELQKKNPSVSFIGVSIMEQDQDKVKPFVEEMGDKMAYRVAIDSVPDKEKGSEGAMAKNWMSAAGQNGIPSAFIVNKEGKIAWIGHPMEMDKPLEKIAAGNWDLKEAREEQRKATEMQAKMMKVQTKLVTALRAGDPKKLVAVIDEIVGEIPSAELMVGPMKLTALIKLDEQDKALEYAKKLSKTELSKQAQGLNGLAWAILDPDAGLKPSSKLIDFALETARQADEMADSKDGAIADTLAKAYFDSGDAKKAIEAQERALRLMKEAGANEDQGMKDRLEKYKKAAK